MAMNSHNLVSYPSISFLSACVVEFITIKLIMPITFRIHLLDIRIYLFRFMTKRFMRNVRNIFCYECVIVNSEHSIYV